MKASKIVLKIGVVYVMFLPSLLLAQTAGSGFTLRNPLVDLAGEETNGIATTYAGTNTPIDIDNDGNKEFLIRTDNTLVNDVSIRIYETTGANTFAERASILLPVTTRQTGYIRSIFVANVDGDVQKEIVVNAEGDAGQNSIIYIIDILDDGHFTATQHPNSPILRGNNTDKYTGVCYLGDLDADTNPEFITADNGSSSSSLNVLEWSGAGWTSRAVAAPSNGVSAMEVGNIDGDSRLEVALIRDETGTAAFSIFEVQVSLGVFTIVADGTITNNIAYNTVNPSYNHVRMFDLDLDGDNEIICVSADNNGVTAGNTAAIYVFENTGGSNYNRDITTAGGLQSTSGDFASIGAGNFDNDAGGEILYSVVNAATTAYREHNGTDNGFAAAQFAAATNMVTAMGTNIEAGAIGATPFDNSLDGDRRADVIIATLTTITNDVYFLEANTTFFVTSATVPAGSYNAITVNGAGITATLGGSISTDGNITLTAGKMAIGANTLTINASFSGSATNSLVANGLSSTIVIAPGSGGAMGTLFFDQTTPGTTNRVLNFTMNRTSRTVTLGNAMELTGTLTPTAGTFASAGFLTLISNAAGTANIGTGSGTYLSGNVRVQRFIPASSRRYRFLASPVSAATLEDWRTEIHITGAGTGTLVGTINSTGFDATLTNSPSVYRYNEAVITGTLDNGWVAQTNLTSSLTGTSLVVGRGYRVFVRGPRSDGNGLIDGTNNTQNAVTMDVVGAPNRNNITMPVTFTSSGNAANDGWCFVGNPYASAYNWDAYFDAAANYTNISPTVYVFDASTNSYKSYNASTNSGTLVSGIIASGSAFFVKATAASPAMTFVETHKTTMAPIQTFKTTPNYNELRIKLSLSDENSDETIIKYMPEAKDTMEDFDILKLLNPNVNISSYIHDSLDVTLNARPALETSDTIHLRVNVSTTGTYKFDFSLATFANGKPVSLYDYFTNSVVDLRKAATYQFEVSKDNAASFGANRFKVVVSENQSGTTPINEPVQTMTNEAPVLVLAPNPATDVAYITANKPINEEMHISIMDLTGKIIGVNTHNFDTQNKIAFDLAGFNSGIYFITVLSNKNKISKTFKLIKN